MAFVHSLHRILLAFLLLAMLSSAVAFPGVALAAPRHQPAIPPGGNLVQPGITIAPGESAEIAFQSYCLDIHKPQPLADELQTISGLAEEPVLKILGEAIEQGMTTAPDLRERFQPQYAIWRFDARPEAVFCLDYYTGQPIDDTGARMLSDLASNATPAPAIPAEPADAVPLHEALSAGLTVEGFDFSPVDSQIDPRLPSCFTEPLQLGQLPDRRFAGQGVIHVRNDSQQPIVTYLAYGTIIEPAGASEAQRLVTYAIAQTAPPEASPTPEPTMGATATPSAEPTALAPEQPATTPTSAAGRETPTQPSAEEPTATALPTAAPTPVQSPSPTATQPPGEQPHPTPEPTPPPAPEQPGTGFLWLLAILILLLGSGILILRNE